MTTLVDHEVTAVSRPRNHLGSTRHIDGPCLVWASNALLTGASMTRIPQHHRFAP